MERLAIILYWLWHGPPGIIYTAWRSWVESRPAFSHWSARAREIKKWKFASEQEGQDALAIIEAQKLKGPERRERLGQIYREMEQRRNDSTPRH